MNLKSYQTNLRGAIHKARPCRYLRDRNEWVGVFTPSEIYVLLEEGVRHNYMGHEIEWIRRKMKLGLSKPHWFYFFPNGLKMKDIHTHDLGRT